MYFLRGLEKFANSANGNKLKLKSVCSSTEILIFCRSVIILSFSSQNIWIYWFCNIFTGVFEITTFCYLRSVKILMGRLKIIASTCCDVLVTYFVEGHAHYLQNANSHDFLLRISLKHFLFV